MEFHSFSLEITKSKPQSKRTVWEIVRSVKAIAKVVSTRRKFQNSSQLVCLIISFDEISRLGLFHPSFSGPFINPSHLFIVFASNWIEGYRNMSLISQFISEQGKILSRQVLNHSSHLQIFLHCKSMSGAVQSPKNGLLNRKG